VESAHFTHVVQELYGLYVLTVVESSFKVVNDNAVVNSMYKICHERF
jgi:hypothetical protein